MKIAAVATATLGLTAGLAGASTNGMAWESVGVRYGISATHLNDVFQQAEAFTRVDLPWRWQVMDDWLLQWRADFSVGWIYGNKDHGIIGTLGTSVAIKYKDFPISIEIGSCPTLMSRDEFGDKDFGIPFQFTSFGGFSGNIGKRWAVGYRFQHMSNAGLARPNPGLEMHMFSVRYRF